MSQKKHNFPESPQKFINNFIRYAKSNSEKEDKFYISPKPENEKLNYELREIKSEEEIFSFC